MAIYSVGTQFMHSLKVKETIIQSATPQHAFSTTSTDPKPQESFSRTQNKHMNIRPPIIKNLEGLTWEELAQQYKLRRQENHVVAQHLRSAYNTKLQLTGRIRGPIERITPQGTPESSERYILPEEAAGLTIFGAGFDTTTEDDLGTTIRDAYKNFIMSSGGIYEGLEKNMPNSFQTETPENSDEITRNLAAANREAMRATIYHISACENSAISFRSLLDQIIDRVGANKMQELVEKSRQELDLHVSSEELTRPITAQDIDKDNFGQQLHYETIVDRTFMLIRTVEAIQRTRNRRLWLDLPELNDIATAFRTYSNQANHPLIYFANTK